MARARPLAPPEKNEIYMRLHFMIARALYAGLRDLIYNIGAAQQRREGGGYFYETVFYLRERREEPTRGLARRGRSRSKQGYNACVQSCVWQCVRW